jgi:hypothetical protein
MSKINLFKKHLAEKRAVKVIAGIDNFDIDRIKKVVSAANYAGASAIDICADMEILKTVQEMTDLPVFVSSIVPSELAKAVENGADAIELGNFDALYKKGLRFDAQDVLKLTKETISLLNQETFFCVTVPGHISVSEQIELARKLEELGIDLIQTEGAAIANIQSEGARGLMETAQVSIANTIELVRNIEIPVMTASGISSTTAPLAFAAGASAIGVGSCINKPDSSLAMIAAAKSLVEIAERNIKKETVLA